MLKMQKDIMGYLDSLVKKVPAPSSKAPPSVAQQITTDT